MDIFLNLLIQFYLNSTLAPYVMSYLQNSDRIVNTDFAAVSTWYGNMATAQVWVLFTSELLKLSPSKVT